MTPQQSANPIVLRDALIGGATVALAVIAQQESDTAELRLFGLAAMFGGLLLTGMFTARDAGGRKRDVAARTGAAAGVLAGLLAGLAMIGMSLIWSVNGMTEQRIQLALVQVYTADQLRTLSDNGMTLESLVQFTTLFQIVCCGAGLPLIGLVLGAIGGAFAVDVFKSEPPRPNYGRRD